MYSHHTISSILALASIDENVTSSEKDALQMLLLGKKESCCKIVRYKDAADRLGLSVSAVKKLTRDGKLKKVYGLGDKKACGISEESIRRLAS